MQKKTKRKTSKPKPSDLGAGGAARAARLLKNRKARMDAILNEATGNKRKKRKATKKRGHK